MNRENLIQRGEDLYIHTERNMSIQVEERTDTFLNEEYYVVVLSSEGNDDEYISDGMDMVRRYTILSHESRIDSKDDAKLLLEEYINQSF